MKLPKWPVLKSRDAEIRQKLRAASTATNTRDVHGKLKTGRAPKPITLPKLAFLGDTMTESGGKE